MISVGELISAADKTASVLKVLAPAAEQVAAWLEGGPEPEIFATYPSELKSIAALERLKYRAETQPPKS
jgi:hypothetical protein